MPPAKITESHDVALSRPHQLLFAIWDALDTAELADRIIAHFLKAFGAAEVELFFYEEGKGTLRRVRKQPEEGLAETPRPLSLELFEEVVRRRRAVLATSERDGLTFLYAPLLSGDRVLGAIGVRQSPER